MATAPTVCVITGATGHPNLKKCIQSVQAQTYGKVKHLVVVDGPEWNKRFDAVVNSLGSSRGVEIIRLPYPTGRDFWVGHRIYGAMPSIAMTDYVCWLDEDNWYEPQHVESLINSVQSTQSVWSFALRRIMSHEGKLITLDLCESLGNLHPSFLNPNDFHIDTSCYMLRSDTAIQLAGVWNRRGRARDGNGPDRLLCRILMEQFPTGRSTGRFTVNYLVGNTPHSATADFFTHGNQIMRAKYPDGLPFSYQE